MQTPDDVRPESNPAQVEPKILPETKTGGVQRTSKFNLGFGIDTPVA